MRNLKLKQGDPDVCGDKDKIKIDNLAASRDAGTATIHLSNATDARALSHIYFSMRLSHLCDTLNVSKMRKKKKVCRESLRYWGSTVAAS